jgi:sarcosine oxidase subunit alpha
LGKLLVKGPDAGRFLDMLYTNMMSTLPIGKCRYGLMCSENGFLSDDGVVARIAEDEWLCHTTTGGADRIHAHMEEWLQTEWPDMNVYCTSVTEQWAVAALNGPRARDLLSSISDIDCSNEAFPFMSMREGTIAGIPARVYRISFTGELAYEINVPARYGRKLWETLLEAGKAYDLCQYGTVPRKVLLLWGRTPMVRLHRSIWI